MKSKKSVLISFIILLSVLLLASCSNEIRDIPSGFVGKKLTPTGWDKDIMESGQVDLGVVNNDGTSTSLVLLEVTTITVKESFSITDSSDKEDHRVRTKDGQPLSVDIYIQVSIPIDRKVRDGIFAMVTPVPTSERRVSKITVEAVYDKFVRMTIRGNTRTIFAKYLDADDVMKNYSKVNAEISQMIIDARKEANAPFEIVNAQLSNVKEDPSILESKNRLMSAKNEAHSIEIVGEAIRKNPQYLEARKLDVLEKIGSKSNSNLVIMDTKSSNTTLALPVK